MACRSHSQHRPESHRRERSVPSLAGSAPKQFSASFEIQLLREPQPAADVPDPGTTPPADTVSRQWANSSSTCSLTDLPLPDSYRVYRFDHSTAERLLPNASPASGKPCHPQSTPPRDCVSAWLAAPAAAPVPASPRHSRAHPPPNDEATGACAERRERPSALPLARHSCARLATTSPCSSSSTVYVGQHVLRHSPGPPCMPRSASPVGLARRVVIPQNNSTRLCSFITQ